MSISNKLKQLMQNPAAAGLTGAVAGGAITALPLGKKTRKALTSAATFGGIGVLGSMAYNAYRRSQGAPERAAVEQPNETSPVTLDAFMPKSAADEQRLADALITAMISAARADGELDATERAAVESQINSLGLRPSSPAVVSSAMTEPADPTRIAELARSEPEALELYTASVAIIEVDTQAEHRYLRQLEWHLGIDPATAAEIRRSTQPQQAGHAPFALPDELTETRRELVRNSQTTTSAAGG